MRQGRPGIRGEFVQVEPRMSLTGANADEWVPSGPAPKACWRSGSRTSSCAPKLRPADAAGRAGALIDGWASGPRRLHAAGRRAEDRRRGRAHRAARARAGRPAAGRRDHRRRAARADQRSVSGARRQRAQRAARQRRPSRAASRSRRRPARAPGPAKTLRACRRGHPGRRQPPVQVLLVDDVNPVFATPPAWRVSDALLKVPFIVELRQLPRRNERARRSDPARPLVPRIVDRRAARVGRDRRRRDASPARRCGRCTRHARRRTSCSTSREARRAASARTAVDDVRRDAAGLDRRRGLGGRRRSRRWVERRAQGGGRGRARRGRKGQSGRGQRAREIARERAVRRRRGDSIRSTSCPYASQAFLDGSLAHLPWLQEMPDPITTAMWSSWVEINPQTAARLRIAEGDVVEIALGARDACARRRCSRRGSRPT